MVGSLIDSLRESSKGQLHYDRNWLQEGRAQSILNGIATNLSSLSLSPNKLVSEEKKHCDETDVTHIEPEKCKVESDSKPSSPSGKDSFDDLHLMAIYSLSEVPLVEYEKETTRRVKEVITARQANVEQYSKLCAQEVEQYLQVLARNRELAKQKEAEKQKKDAEQGIKEISQRQEELKEQMETRAKLLKSKIKEAELRQRQLEEERKRRAKEEEEARIQKLKTCQNDIRLIIQLAMNTLLSCPHQQLLRVSSSDRASTLEEVRGSIEHLIENCQSKGTSAEDIENALQLVSKVQQLSQVITADTEQAVLKAQEEAIRHKVDSREEQNWNKESVEERKHSSPDEQEIDNSNTDKEQDLEQENPLFKYVTPVGFRIYTRLMEKLEKWQQSYEPLVQDSKMKKYKFNLQKAVNIPVNTISDVSGAHLLDKLQRLGNLLSNQTVSVGDHHVSCREHPNGLAFCYDLLAKKLVSQGEGQIASKHESAFAVAGVIVGLWCNYPDLGDLILAHFYTRCPYLVPYYVPQQEGQSEEDYYRALGYTYTDGVVEKQDKFLKRMSGFMRLYAAILQTSPPPSCKTPNPHGINHGWQWLAQVLNLQPRPDITATLLLDFLEFAGHAMLKAYGQQFQKLLHILCTGYFPKIKKVTPPGSSGPVSRLEAFLQKAIKSRIIQPPEGALKTDFWFTS
ncbi:gle1 RNA export mediator [Tachypleus tridentatus]|uniref:gle1 RNA export mediator n=1 Tax=Tachypleus tridentatus TaxID=6853 RepID=UPI003FD28D9F